MVKVTIEVSGFPGARVGAKFFEQIVKDQYKRLFEGSNLRAGRDNVIVFEVNVRCKTTGHETEWFVGSETMHHSKNKIKFASSASQQVLPFFIRVHPWLKRALRRLREPGQLLIELPGLRVMLVRDGLELGKERVDSPLGVPHRL